MNFLGIFDFNKKRKISNKQPLSDSQWPDYVVTLDGKTVKEFIQKYPLSLVDFWASWCAPCRAMAPRLRRLSKIYKGKVAFGKLNIQENQDIAKYYRLVGIPCIVLFSHGKKVTTITSVKSVGYIKEIIENPLEKREGILK
jgi:thioredoxin 1